MRVAAVLLAGLMLAGCTAPQPAGLEAHARGSFVLASYDASGRTGQAGDGRADIRVDAKGDTGSAVFTFPWRGREWDVRFVRFAANASWQDGGVRADFDERGGTGLGDAQLPKLHALHAGWGWAEVRAAGELLTDATTGDATFWAHYVVAEHGPWNLSTHRISTAAGNGVYAAARPQDVRYEPAPQVLLEVSSALPSPKDGRVALGFTVTDPLWDATTPIAVLAANGNLTLNVTVPRPPNTFPAAKLDFTFRDPVGAVLGNWTYDPTVFVGNDSIPRKQFAVPPPLLVGNYSLEAKGPGVGAEYTLISDVRYPPNLFLHVVYGNVTRG